MFTRGGGAGSLAVQVKTARARRYKERTNVRSSKNVFCFLFKKFRRLYLKAQGEKRQAQRMGIHNHSQKHIERAVQQSSP